MPLGPRPASAGHSAADRPDEDRGLLYYVENVYVGTGMETVEPGSVKYLRVVESPEKRFWTGPAWDGGTGQQAPGMAWNDFNNKRIVGTAPVESDGSAYVAVPADKFVYFQLLDERGMMVQSMRSGTIVRPGETTGCVGCHDQRRSSAQLAVMSVHGLATGPAQIGALVWPAAAVQLYMAEVQPVLRPALYQLSRLRPRSRPKTESGRRPGRGLQHLVHRTPLQGLMSRWSGAGTVPSPECRKSWGSHASRLTKVLRDGHGDAEIDAKVKLDPEGFDRLVTWIDINAPYYPDYAGGAYRDNPFGRAPLTERPELKRLSELTGVNLMDRGQFDAGQFHASRRRVPA
jgi:hypothetical protein